MGSAARYSNKKSFSALEMSLSALILIASLYFLAK